MTTQDRFERILSDLDWCARAARIGMKRTQSLDSKIKAGRVEAAIREARRLLHIQLFEFEDATEGVTPEDMKKLALDSRNPLEGERGEARIF